MAREHNLEKIMNVMDLPEGRLNQIFINQGLAGGDEAARTAAIGVLLSFGLQFGVPPQAYIKTLAGIKSNTNVFMQLCDGKEQQFGSLADSLSFILHNYVESIEEPWRLDKLNEYYSEENYPYLKQIFDVEPVTKGVTIKRTLSDGSPIRLTLNPHKQKGLAEVLIMKGASGGDDNAYYETLGKIISTNLQHGMHPFVMIDSLRGIRSTQIGYVEGASYTSVEDCIAREIFDWYLNKGINLEEHYNATLGNQDFIRRSKKGEILISREPCENCGSRIYEKFSEPGSRSCGTNSCCGHKYGTCG
ncbi:MAG: hypothetical protein KKG60_04175 [Nanoarchaeota archaeon]|nr:hypothetical protein [Nanoarchaeota archaeon]